MGIEEKGRSGYRRLGFVSGYILFKALQPDVVTEEDDVRKEGSAGSCPSEKSVKVGAAWEAGGEAGENISEARGKHSGNPAGREDSTPSGGSRKAPGKGQVLGVGVGSWCRRRF